MKTWFDFYLCAVTIMWNLTPREPFARVEATDIDEGDNAKLSFSVTSNNNKGSINNLFEVRMHSSAMCVRIARFVL
jgi:hypothetical protein